MMRWNPTEIDNSGANDVMARHDAPARQDEGSTVRYLFDAAIAAVAAIGVRSAVIMLVMALVIATLVFGFSADESAAMVQWCRSC